MKCGMLPSIRKMCGLGNELFYDNTSESAHAKFKNETQRQISVTASGKIGKCIWSQVADIYKGFVKQSQHVNHRVLIGQVSKHQTMPIWKLHQTNGKL